MSIGKRLRAAMDRAGVTSEAELSRISGIHQPTVHRILSGESSSPRQSNIMALADALTVHVHWLTYGTGPMEPDVAHQRRPELVILEGQEPSDNQRLLNSDEVELPTFQEIEKAAGSGRTQVVENQSAKQKFEVSMLHQAKVPVDSASCAFMVGNSMKGIIPDGSKLVLNKADTSVRDGKIYALDHEGMLRIKYLYRLPGGGVRMVSENKAEHPDEDYTAEAFAGSVTILGRVFSWLVLDM